MGIMNFLLNIYTARSVDKDCKKGEDNFSFKKVLIIGGIISLITFLVPLIIAICLFSYSKNRMENMQEQFILRTGTFVEKQALLEPEELKKEYVDLFEQTNLINSVDDAIAEVMADYGMVYLAGGANDVYVVSDGYFMYYLDLRNSEPFITEVTNEDGNVKSLNDFMSEKSSK